MKLDTYFQGDDIPFQIELFEDENETIKVSIDQYDDLDIYLYTDGRRIVKISKTQKTGYIKLNRVSEYIYSCTVSSGETKLLAPGFIQMEINTEKSGSINKIGAGIIALLRKSLIKIES